MSYAKAASFVKNITIHQMMLACPNTVDVTPPSPPILSSHIPDAAPSRFHLRRIERRIEPWLLLVPRVRFGVLKRVFEARFGVQGDLIRTPDDARPVPLREEHGDGEPGVAVRVQDGERGGLPRECHHSVGTVCFLLVVFMTWGIELYVGYCAAMVSAVFVMCERLLL